VATTDSTGSNNDVYARRLERAQAEMARQDVDFLFVTPSSDLTYLLGYPAHASERLTLLGVPRDGEPFIVAPTLEASRLENRRDIIDIHRWGETDSPTRLVAQLVEGAAGATVVVSDQTWAAFLLRLQSELPETRFIPATNVIRELRMIKDEHEIQMLREAGAKADKVWEEFASGARLSGRTERDVADEISARLTAEGLPGAGFNIVGSGPNSASPHHMTSERVIQQGDAIVFDFGGLWHHYWCDITRTLHVGEPGAEFRKVYDTVLAANAAAKAATRPGVACESIDRAARDVIEAAGYGEYFIHRVGHGLGMDSHEEPYMVGGNDLPLQPGMVFSDEPGIYIPGQFGVRIEDILVCTADGYESFNHAHRDLVVAE
jgi:Xaa-Pro aminopeptidase